MKIGEALKILRRYKGVTQEDLASTLNLERSTYAKLEQDKTDLRLRLAAKLAAFYGMELHYFVLCLESSYHLFNNATQRVITIQKARENKN